MGIGDAARLISHATGTINVLGPSLITATGALVGVVLSVIFDRNRSGRHEKAPDGEPTPDDAPDRDEINDAELHEQLLNRATSAEAREAALVRELTALRRAKVSTDVENGRLRELLLTCGYDPRTGERLDRP